MTNIIIKKIYEQKFSYPIGNYYWRSCNGWCASIFQAYPAKILDDQKYSGGTENGQIEEIPPEVERKLNLLAQKLQERGVTFESFFQKELDDAINGGYWDKANNLLDNFLQSYE